MARTIAVSGSASGIGKALAALLRDAGDTVIGIDLRGADVCADLSVPEGRADAVAQTLERAGGRLDAVVACAGVSDFTIMPVKVNFFGVVELLDGLRPALAAAEAPRAAVVASISGTHPVDDDVVRACLDLDEPAAIAAATKVEESGAGGRLYPSSKSALAQWMRRVCTAPEWAGAGIPLNAIAPGVVKTAMTKPLFDDEAMFQIMNEAVPMPLNGYADPEVIAEALRWLVSPGNTHMTGQVIYVDGGAEATLRDASHF
ncbi:SDR family oxidoreductase [Actinomadura bangladeshensis]|uniref:SDR family oxidoreductase n=1 Tax=Actinomadura bangladeshensis TaxID=453573 RepID=A0A6L9QSV6_9ACTN|nr:SDR family oxidoreductase [Actinomadura bangladeshensis]NEA28228.1 SDR family oxidoreductase [Actinomadura bangladeshensis]